MQTEKSQPEGKRIMPETEFPALSVDSRLGFLGLHRRPMIDYFSYILLNKIILIPDSFYNLRCMTAIAIRSFSLRRAGVVCKQLTSHLASRVSCLSPWVRQNFQAPLKIELCPIGKKK